MSISRKIEESIKTSSWIRKMFEEGTKLKAQFGEENVFDFSLGNPDLDPPEEFFRKLKELTSVKKKGAHGYMPNAGYPDVRNAIAKHVSREHGIDISSENIIMTCGAAGGLNTVLKTILNPGDQVIVLRPYFVEYGFYIGNHNGEMVLIDTNSDFSLNVDNLKKKITEKTKAVLINSPNNPTGKIYTESEIIEFSEILLNQCNENRTIYLISDEPYRDIAYDNISVPSILKLYKNSIMVTSFSKNLSLAGERIGYIAANPAIKNNDIFMAGLILSNRILGFVNAPALMQRIVAGLTEVKVDIAEYKRRRDIFIDGLKSAGYVFTKPEGAFYIFCKTPTEDDIRFVQHLQKFNILAVPGSGFGVKGYFRIAYCVSEGTIKNSLPKFREALKSYK